MASGNPFLSHISIGVHSFDVAKKFYSAALAPLGLDLVYEDGDPSNTMKPRTLGYGPDEDNEILNIFEHGDASHPPGRGCHIAFGASSRSAVDAFHAAAIANGGVCDGKPGLREHYGRDYYAAFVVDPDGWRLEVVTRSAI